MARLNDNYIFKLPLLDAIKIFTATTKTLVENHERKQRLL